MIIVAKSVKGHEFAYSPKSAHKVSKASAKYICDVLNECKYDISENDVWYIHEVDKYDTAFDYAETQHFSVRNGIVKRHYCAY